MLYTERKNRNCAKIKSNTVLCVTLLRFFEEFFAGRYYRQ